MKKALYFLISIVLAASFIGCAGVFNNSKNKHKDKPTVNNSKPEAKKEFDELTDFKIKETEHFQIYYVEDDKECSDQVGDTLEKNYQRIVEDLKPEEVDRIEVRIYPNLVELHKAMRNENAADWVVGTSASKRKLLMVSPNRSGPVHDYYSMMSVAVHEFTHCIAGFLNNNPLPKWAGEGVALYEANQMVPLPEVYKLPTFSDLNEEDNNEIYSYGYYIFDFIEKKYGKEYIRSLILNNGDIEKTFKCNMQQFEAKWKDYMKDIANKK